MLKFKHSKLVRKSVVGFLATNNKKSLPELFPAGFFDSSL